MSSSWRVRLSRSLQNLQSETKKTLTWSHLKPTPNTPYNIARLTTAEDLKSFVTGCDGDVGGFSTVKLDLDENGKGRFSGFLSDKLNPKMKINGEKAVRSGYAGFRSQKRPALFDELKWDLSRYGFLRLRLKNSGDAMRYFVNIQAVAPVETNVFQHRLWLGKVGKWEDVLIPFEEFAYTNAAGRDVSNTSSAAMLGPNISDERNYLPTDRILTVGISVLGPGTGQFELGVESIDAVNVGVSDSLKADVSKTKEIEQEDDDIRRETEEALERNKRQPIPTPRPAPAAATTV